LLIQTILEAHSNRTGTMNTTKSTMNPNLSGGDGVSRTGRSGWVSRAGGLRGHEDEARMGAASMSTGTLEMRVFFF
jgi:hypothetical protein